MTTPSRAVSAVAASACSAASAKAPRPGRPPRAPPGSTTRRRRPCRAPAPRGRAPRRVGWSPRWYAASAAMPSTALAAGAPDRPGTRAPARRPSRGSPAGRGRRRRRRARRASRRPRRRPRGRGPSRQPPRTFASSRRSIRSADAQRLGGLPGGRQRAHAAEPACSRNGVGGVRRGGEPDDVVRPARVDGRGDQRVGHLAVQPGAALDGGRDRRDVGEVGEHRPAPQPVRPLAGGAAPPRRCAPSRAADGPARRRRRGRGGSRPGGSAAGSPPGRGLRAAARRGCAGPAGRRAAARRATARPRGGRR